MPSKEKILNEIQRIAAEVGSPPGNRTFIKLSGISENEWKGIYWARWGDALNDAGFEANTIQQRHDDDFLLEKYCEATLYFGKAPTKPEMRMYAKRVSNFPSYATMQTRFGSMAAIRAHARLWAENNDAYSEVFDIIPYVETTVTDKGTNHSADGWVYLLKSGQHYKIGRGEDLERRIKQVSVALPEKIQLVHSIKTDDPSGIEAYWHNRFKQKRANGEWFRLTPEDVKTFKRRKFQ